MERTITTRSGKSVVTSLTDEQAHEICKGISSDFAQSISTALNPTEEQKKWMHVLAVKEVGRKAEQTTQVTINIGNCAGINALFENAKQHLKNPKNTLLVNGKVIRLAPGKKEAYAQQIFIDNGENRWSGLQEKYGRIDAEGNFYKTGICPEGMAEYLVKFAANPAEEAANYGKLTGNCCFCTRPLKDERSTEVGYGKTCSTHYNLHWGKKRGNSNA
jgi:hypothetical protein